MREARELKWMICQQEKSQSQIKDLGTSYLSGWIIPQVKEEPELLSSDWSWAHIFQLPKDCPNHTAWETLPILPSMHLLSSPGEGRMLRESKKNIQQKKRAGWQFGLWTLKLTFQHHMDLDGSAGRTGSWLIKRNLAGRYADGSGI